MDAIEFLKEKRRMCKTICNCDKCDIYKENSDCDTRCFVYPKEAVEVVEKWAKEHPVETRQSEFLRHYPYAPFPIGQDFLPLCPRSIDYRRTCPRAHLLTAEKECTCDECKKMYWLAEVDCKERIVRQECNAK